MAIKRFEDDAPVEPTPEPEGTARKSSFSPWIERVDTGKKELGSKVYSGNGDQSGRYTDNDELAEAMLVTATDAYNKVEKLVKQYERASKSPTRNNVKAYADAIQDIISGDPKVAAAILSVLTGTLYTLASGGGPGSGKRR